MVANLFAAGTEVEQTFLRRLLGGELRQGALIGVMADAVAKAAGIPAPVVRRAAMLAGDLPAVASAALTGGQAALERFTLRVGQPVGPMLAQTATGVAEALERLGGTAIFEAKLDGARVQIHRAGDQVSVYTRSLDDVTERLPEVVHSALQLPVTDLIADAEAIALRPDLRPHRFQVTASRFGRSVDIEAARAAQPLSVFFFDLLHLDGADLLDRPTTERIAALDAIVPAAQRVNRLITADAEAAGRFLDETLAAGHEGLMAKSPTAPYEAGRRGAGWLKVKPVHTLDLVVLAVEWGSGRRTGKLSNIHLGAYDPATGGFVMLGKTFKGMTDAMLDWQTTRFIELADGPTDGVRGQSYSPSRWSRSRSTACRVRHAIPAAWRLRFARVLRYRDDKRPAEADTIDTVRRCTSAVRDPIETPVSTPTRFCSGRITEGHLTQSSRRGRDRGHTHRRTIGPHRRARRRRHVYPHGQGSAAGSDHRPIADHHPAQDHLRHHCHYSARSRGRSSRSSAGRRSTRCGSSSRRSAPM